jgi:hypothetical protein
MSAWRDYDIPGLVRNILGGAGHDETYGSGRAFLTAYHLAAEFAHLYPQEAQGIAASVGGRGRGPFALSTYLARQVADHIRRGELPDMEVAFLGARGITRMEFAGGVHATTLQNQDGLTMFRLTTAP